MITFCMLGMLISLIVRVIASLGVPIEDTEKLRATNAHRSMTSDATAN